MSDIRLSILIPCHLKSPWFTEALDSILNSGYHFRNAEILICDDASPAGGDGDTARNYQERYPGLIRVVRNGTNQGVSLSLARLHAESRGKYLMFFDSDDIFLPFDIDGNMDRLDRTPEAAMVYGSKRKFSALGDLREIHGVDYSHFSALIQPTPGPNASILSSAAVHAAGGIQSTPGSFWDMFLWLRLGQTHKLLFDGSLRSFYRSHSEQTTEKHRDAVLQNRVFMLQWLIDRHPDLFRTMKDGGQIVIDETNRIPFVMFAGYLSENADCPIEQKLHMLQFARIAAPDDYKIPMRLAQIFTGAQRYAEAMAEYLDLLTRFPDRNFIAAYAWTGVYELCAKSGLDSQRFQSASDGCFERLFALTPAQQSLLDRTIENFKHPRAPQRP